MIRTSPFLGGATMTVVQSRGFSASQATAALHSMGCRATACHSEAFKTSVSCPYSPPFLMKTKQSATSSGPRVEHHSVYSVVAATHLACCHCTQSVLISVEPKSRLEEKSPSPSIMCSTLAIAKPGRSNLKLCRSCWVTSPCYVMAF